MNRGLSYRDFYLACKIINGKMQRHDQTTERTLSTLLGSSKNTDKRKLRAAYFLTYNLPFRTCAIFSKLTVSACEVLERNRNSAKSFLFYK